VSWEQRRSYRWMAEVLDALFEHLDDATAVNMLRDKKARDLSPEVVAIGSDVRRRHPELEDIEFDNLFVALLALRVKFPHDEATRKVAMNIAMRERRN